MLNILLDNYTYSLTQGLNCSNCTSFNETKANDKLSDLIIYGTTSVILGLIILITVIGNVFVIAAIILERNLQHVANYLIVSLAVADLMVACLVMPLGAVYEINKGWILGPELCDIWTSFDVLCCTASILHLVAIAIDRYWAVTNVNYIHSRSVKRIGIMIFLIWLVAIIVSLAPQFGWKDPEYLDRINIQQKCLVSQDVAYQIFATCSTFYVPLLIILIVYWKIFQTARKRIHRRRKQKQVTKETPFTATSSNIKDNNGHIEPVLITDKEDNKIGKLMSFWAKFNCDKRQKSSQKSQDSDTTTYELANTIRKDSEASVIGTTAPNTTTTTSRREKKESLEAKRERKAAKTLAIITGAFVICWLPFFIMAILLPLCDVCHISDFVSSLFLWLGYFNSTLNPVIYTIFSPEFRQAFKRILCGNKRQNTTSSRYIVNTKG